MVKRKDDKWVVVDDEPEVVPLFYSDVGLECNEDYYPWAVFSFDRQRVAINGNDVLVFQTFSPDSFEAKLADYWKEQYQDLLKEHLKPGGVAAEEMWTECQDALEAIGNS